MVAAEDACEVNGGPLPTMVCEIHSLCVKVSPGRETDVLFKRVSGLKKRLEMAMANTMSSIMIASLKYWSSRTSGRNHYYEGDDSPLLCRRTKKPLSKRDDPLSYFPLSFSHSLLAGRSFSLRRESRARSF